MLETSNRPLTDQERGLLQAELDVRRSLPPTWQRVWLSAAIVIGQLCVLTLLCHWPPALTLGGGTALTVAIGGWAGISATRRHRSLLRSLAEAMHCPAQVTRIGAEEMVEIEESDDEGACYAFQVDERRIAFVAGQDFYASDRFPNSDFSLVHVSDNAGRHVDTLLVEHGRKLAPLRTIPAESMRGIAPPEHLATIEGRLEQLEQLLGIPLHDRDEQR